MNVIGGELVAPCEFGTVDGRPVRQTPYSASVGSSLFGPSRVSHGIGIGHGDDGMIVETSDAALRSQRMTPSASLREGPHWLQVTQIELSMAAA